ncbi:MAG: hypothetical protein K940chlam2_01524 [Chlamydiae bacterium]|nr:hypothetical protein [Chlamydiota bacterium]
MHSVCLFLLLMGTTLFSAPTEESPGGWESALKALTLGDRQALEAFFRAALKDALGGYVLYGEKPVCVENINAHQHHGLGSNYLPFDHFHKSQIYFKKGYEVWKGLPLESKKYLIHLSDDTLFGGYDLIFVNKKSVKEEFFKSSALFRYVMGPATTAESILDAFETKGESLYPLTNDNRVLIGILLGYGVENALMQSRHEYIFDSLWDHEQIYPLQSSHLKSILSRKNKKDASLYAQRVHGPSFSFSTILDENTWLRAGNQLSLARAPSDKLAFPWFGYWEGTESEGILNSYSKTQKKLAAVLNSDHFLEEIFDQLFSE